VKTDAQRDIEIIVELRILREYLVGRFDEATVRHDVRRKDQRRRRQAERNADQRDQFFVGGRIVAHRGIHELRRERNGGGVAVFRAHARDDSAEHYVEVVDPARNVLDESIEFRDRVVDLYRWIEQQDLLEVERSLHLVEQRHERGIRRADAVAGQIERRHLHVRPISAQIFCITA
jgi:hypothetical protein